MQMWRSAQDSRRLLDDDLRETYELCLAAEWAGSGLDGNTDESFGSRQLDSEGSIALNERTSEVMGKLFPPFTKSIELEHPTGFYTGDEIAVAEDNIYKAMYECGFYPKMKMFIRSALISIGCMEVKVSNNIKKPFVFRTIPVFNLYPLEDAAGELDRMFVYSSLTKWEIERDYDFDLGVDDDDKDKNRRFNLVEYFETTAEGLTNYYVFIATPTNIGQAIDAAGADSEEYNKIIYKEEMSEMRSLVVARFDRIINRGMGRGPLMAALANLRQLNYLTAQNHDILELQSQGFLFMNTDEIDEEKFDDTQGISFIHKNPGEEAPVLLQFKGQIEYTEAAMQSMRGNINRQIMGPDIPSVNSGVRSATEYDVRVDKRQMLVTPDIVNLYSEIERALVPAVMRILNSAKMARSPYALPEADFDYQPKSRIAELESQRKAGDLFLGISKALQIDPNGGVWDVIDKEAAIRELLKLQRVPASLIMSPQQSKKIALERQKAELMAQKEAAEGNNSGNGNGAGGVGLPTVPAGGNIAPAQLPSINLGAI